MPALLQVGMGRWGLDWATKVFPEVPEMELVACADAHPGALKAACDAGIVTAGQCYSSVADAVADRGIDAVLVTTDGAQHGDIVRAALRARKHVLVEKPFVQSMAEACELVDEAAALNRTLMVSQNYRFFPAVRAAQHIVKGQELGQLIHVDIDFRRFAPTGRHLHWTHPLLLDMGIHHFDLMRAILGREPRTVDCRAWKPSWAGYDDPSSATAIVDFEDGVTVSYRGSQLSPDRPTAWAGEWLMEFEQGTVMWTSRGDRSGLRSAEGDAVSVYRNNRAPDEITASHGITAPNKITAPDEITLPHLELMDRAGTLDAFARALASGTTPESTAEENLGSLALAYAAIRSADRREPVQVTTSPNSR
jgi:predicted dehydrogenase